MKFLLGNNSNPFKLWLLLILLFSALGMQAQNYPKPMSPPRLVNDFAGVLSQSENQLLEDKLRKYNDSTSTELAIILVKTIGNSDVTQYAFGIGQEWGVGKKGRDNGVVILVAVDDRKAAIVTGYGMEGAITDASTYTIRERYMNPNFRNGNFYKGLDEAATAIFKLASGEWKAENLQKSSKKPNVVPILIFLFLFFGTIIIVVIASVKSFKKNHIGGHKNLDLLTILLLMNQMNQKSHRSKKHGGWGGFSGGGGFGGGSSFGGFGGGSFGGGGSGGSW